MTLELTEEEWWEVRQTRNDPVRLTDPETRREYVLLPAEAYERLKSLLYDDRDFDPSMGYALADEVMKEDWDDPTMAEYDRYEEHKPGSLAS
jgi:hypothetical protein